MKFLFAFKKILNPKFMNHGNLLLLVSCLGKKVSFQNMDFKVRSMWQPEGHLSVLEVGLDFFHI